MIPAHNPLDARLISLSRSSLSLLLKANLPYCIVPTRICSIPPKKLSRLQQVLALGFKLCGKFRSALSCPDLPPLETPRHLQPKEPRNEDAEGPVRNPATPLHLRLINEGLASVPLPRPSVTLGLLILAISSVEMKTIPRRRLEKPRIVSGVATNSYNFPYFCAVQMYIDHPEDPNWKPIYRLLGSGTILSKKSVLFSVNILARYLYHFKDRSYQVSDINIVAGSGFLQPTVREGAVQIGRGKRLVISERKRPFAADYIEEHKVGILDGKLNASWFRTLETNALGDLQNEVALLLLNQDLFLSPYIIPAPLISFSLNEIRAAMKPIMEADYLGPDRYGPCVVPGWGPLGENQLMSHRVFHIPFSDCQETICAQIPSACLDYPQRFNHICFKSDSYGDVCVYDQGAPLFCPWFQDSVIAILVRAFDCGLTGLPGVYALIDRVLDVPQIFGVKFEDNTWKNRRHFPWNKNDLREKVTPNYKF